MRACVFSLVLVLEGLLVVAPVCQAAGGQKPGAPASKEGRSTAANSAGPTSPGKLVFADDFSNPGSGWERERDRDFIADYAQGEYQIQNAVDHQVTDGMFEGREVTDGDFSVTAHRVSGPDDIRFGLIARHGEADFVEASILPDGRCSLWARHYEQRVLKTKPDFKPCPAVRRGNETNQLRLVVSGAQATFYVNGQKVAEANNVGREGQHFGLFANSTSAASDVRFDNFKLFAIGPPVR